MKVYLDSCIVIYYVQKHPVYREVIHRALFPAAEPFPTVVISDLTRLECRVFPIKRADSGLLTAFDAFFSAAETRRIAMDTAVFDLATEFRATHGLKTPDALHLAAAVTAGCDELWTNDDRLGKAAADRVRVVIFDQTA